MAEAYLGSVALDVEAARGDAAGLAHVDAIRPFWGRDGAMVLYSTTAAMELLGEQGDLDGTVSFHDDGLATLRRLWPGVTLWLRFRLTAVLVAQMATNVASGRAPSAGSSWRGRRAISPRCGGSSSTIPSTGPPASRRGPGMRGRRPSCLGCAGWPMSTRRARRPRRGVALQRG